MLLEIDETDLICLFDLMDVDRSGDLTYQDRRVLEKSTIIGWNVVDFPTLLDNFWREIVLISGNSIPSKPFKLR